MNNIANEGITVNKNYPLNYNPVNDHRLSPFERKNIYLLSNGHFVVQDENSIFHGLFVMEDNTTQWMAFPKVETDFIEELGLVKWGG